MQSLKITIKIALYLVIVAVIYIVILRFIDPGARWLYHNYITKNLVVEGKKAIDPDRKLSLGMYRPELPYHYDTVVAVEDSLDTKLKVISYYQAWGDGDEHQFNLDVVRNIAKGDYIPMITWEPWVVAFEKYKNNMADSSVALITAGEFDYYIHSWARQIVQYGKPIFLRLGHEMSNPWYTWSNHYGNTPEMYIAMWRHVYEIFQKEGAKNSLFVWSPYTAADSVFYPGNDYVDWIGFDIFNYGALSETGSWYDFSTLTSILYNNYTKYNKPMMIAEVGCSEFGGNKNDWYRDMFHLLTTNVFPQIKLLVIFDNPIGKTATGLDVDWSMTADEAVYSAIKSQVSMDQLNR
ncbi:MAG: hypothetical protein H6696_08105 [Deferribacteres bacterium]|nr:hypothetical protein [candidate division KSB1 bacterium]MCB9501885.1 hypothetical protein [Deferribacteres bacterium]